MSNTSPGWDPVPIYGTWHTDPITESPASGTVSFSLSVRINLVSGARIYLPGYKRIIALDGTGRGLPRGCSG